MANYTVSLNNNASTQLDPIIDLSHITATYTSAVTCTGNSLGITYATSAFKSTTGGLATNLSALTSAVLKPSGVAAKVVDSKTLITSNNNIKLNLVGDGTHVTVVNGNTINITGITGGGTVITIQRAKFTNTYSANTLGIMAFDKDFFISNDSGFVCYNTANTSTFGIATSFNTTWFSSASNKIVYSYASNYEVLETAKNPATTTYRSKLVTCSGVVELIRNFNASSASAVCRSAVTSSAVSAYDKYHVTFGVVRSMVNIAIMNGYMQISSGSGGGGAGATAICSCTDYGGPNDIETEREYLDHGDILLLDLADMKWKPNHIIPVMLSAVAEGAGGSGHTQIIGSVRDYMLDY